MLEPIVYGGVKYGFFFSDTKQQLVGCREQLRKKDTEFDSKVYQAVKRSQKKIVRKCKKMFLFEKIDKNAQFNYLCPCKSGDFFIWGLQKVVCLKQCSLHGFGFRDAWKGSI